MFKILSYNIHKGFSAGNFSFVLHEIEERIQKTNADLVFLQEVIGEHNKHKRHIFNWPPESQYEFLADGVWPHFAYGKNATSFHGNHGNAVLSKFPIISSMNLEISTNRIEKRGALFFSIDTPFSSSPLSCVCIHLGLTKRGRLKQIQKILEKIRKEEPMLLSGDFNDWEGGVGSIIEQEGFEEVFKEVSGKYAKTFPSHLPTLSLDRIYTRGFEVKKAEVFSWNKLSDHAALFAEVCLPGFS